MLIGERRLISDIVTYKVEFSTSLSQNKKFFTRTELTGPVHTDSVPTGTSISELPNPHPENVELHRRN
jgi:hypothetical protein